jgi:hypothetical protein
VKKIVTLATLNLLKSTSFYHNLLGDSSAAQRLHFSRLRASKTCSNSTQLRWQSVFQKTGGSNSAANACWAAILD